MITKFKKIIAIEGLTFILLIALFIFPLYSQAEDSQYKTFKLSDGTILLINKYTDQVDARWDNSYQEWVNLITFGINSLPSPQAIYQLRYNREKPKPNIRPE